MIMSKTMAKNTCIKKIWLKKVKKIYQFTQQIEEVKLPTEKMLKIENIMKKLRCQRVKNSKWTK